MRKMMLVLSVFVTMGMVLSAAALRETHITRPMFAEDRVKIKLTTEAMGKSTLPEGLYAESMSFGFDELDQLVSRGGGTKIVRAHRRVKDRDWETKTGFDRWFIVMLDGRQKITDVLAGFKDNPYIEDAIPEYIAHRLNVPNDPYYNMSWGHNNVAQFPAYVSNYGHIGAAVGTIGYDTNAWQAWDQTQGYGSSSIVIAIIDSGVDYEHADLAANCVAGYDYGDDDNDPMDDAPDEGHGTCCAGIAAAVANNGVGVIGVAGGCSIMPLKIADSNGDMYFTYIENAISHAADNGADVISMSLGAYIEEGDIPTTDVVIEAAYDAGVVIFAATGNYSSQSPDQDYVNYPANHTDVIAVAASSPTAQRKSYTSSDNETWWGSIYGLTSDPADDPAAVDITGPTILPATDVSGAAGYSTGDYYIWFNGTSCATPYVAGAAALVLSRTPSLTPAQVRTRLVSTATDITNEGGTGWDRYTGYGLVNVYGALGTAPAATVDSTSFYIELVTGNIGSRSLTVGNTGEMVLKYTAYREIRALDESYERVGYFPAEWTQQNVSGNTCWIFLPGAFGGSPSSAYDGTLNARLFLASTSSNATTKLISPSMDLSDATAATLTFYHAQAAWDGDQDQLKVYYRTSAGGSWTLLQTYTSDVTSWTQRTINLPNLSSDYFIAFEGITNYGHGVCIDEVVVTRQAPEPDSWLTVAGGVSSSGSIDGIAKDQDVVTIGFNATGLPPGIYSTTMYVDSNSATNPNISIPCTLKVLDEPLPVELASFTATISTDNYVNLTWVTQTETGVQGFYVLRNDSDDLATALTVSELVPATNTSQQQTYAFTDRELQEEGTYYYWLQNTDLDGTVDFHGPVSIAYSSLGAGTPSIPLATALYPAYPNPFNPSTTLSYSLAEPSAVGIDIYNQRGQIVRSYSQDHSAAGHFSLSFDGRDSNGEPLSSGIYLYRMRAGAFSQFRKMVLCK